MIFQPLLSVTSNLGKRIESFGNFTQDSNHKYKYLYLIAGVHGDEVEGVYVLEKLIGEITSAEFQNQWKTMIPIVHIPIVNVDGYYAKTRVNANKVDLNRNLPTKDWNANGEDPKYYPGKFALSEVENQFLEENFQKYPPYLCISFHSWKPMINYNGNCKDIADFLSSYCHYPSVPSVGYDTPGSLGTYLPEKYQAPVITYELPVLNATNSLESIWLENRKGLLEFFLKK